MKKLREHYFNLASKSDGDVAIGVGKSIEMQKKCIKVIEKASEKQIKDIIVIGENLSVVKDKLPWVSVYEDENPENYLVNLLKTGKITGAVRGSLSARKTVTAIKKAYKINKLLRFGPIDVSRRRTFMLGPLGIDEGISIEDKIKLMNCMIEVTKKLGVDPNVALMSLGRKEDIGRNNIVDKTIEDVAKLIDYARSSGIADYVSDLQILLENLDKVKANCILAPTGYIGNVMYRALVHLGCGHSYGGYICGLPDAFIDTSRGGPIEEHLTAIAMAKVGV